MNTFAKITFATQMAATLSIAATIFTVPQNDSGLDGYKTNLKDVESIVFDKRGVDPKMQIRGDDQVLYSIKTDSLYSMYFNVKDSSVETMSIEVSTGIKVGTDVIPLKDIETIKIIEFDDEIDTDGDKLSDYEEIYIYDTNPREADTDGDGWNDFDESNLFNPENPTIWNPKIADEPRLQIELTQTPMIGLNRTVSTGESKTTTLTEGKTVSSSETIGRTETVSSQIQHTVGVNTNVGFEISAGPKEKGVKFHGSIGMSAANTFSNSAGTARSYSEQNALSKSYNEAVAQATSQNETITGTSIFMQVRLTNSGEISYNIDKLTLSATVHNAQLGDMIIAELSLCTDNASDVSIGTLQPGESVEKFFCNRSVPRSLSEQFINNPGAVFLSAATHELSNIKEGPYTAIKTNFTEIYTKVKAKNAHVIIDYGPNVTHQKESEDFFVSTNYHYNPNHTRIDDLYEKTTLKQALETIRAEFVEKELSGSAPNTPPVTAHSLYSINGVTAQLDSGKGWFISIQKAATPNEFTIYSPYIGYSLDSLTISAGDEVIIFFTRDDDMDGLPLRTEKLIGTSDSISDTDGDGLSDFEEVYGWTRINGDDTMVFYTDPIMKDSDGDGVDDKDDEDPLNRPLSTSTKIKNISFKRLLDKQNALIVRRDERLDDTANVYDLYGSKVRLEIETMTPVKQILVYYNDSTFIPTVKDNLYTFDIALSVTNKIMKVTVAPESGEDKNYYFNLHSSLIGPNKLTLARTADHENIIGNIASDIVDDQIQGYAIVRTESPEKIPNDKNRTEQLNKSAEDIKRKVSEQVLINLDTLDFSKLSALQYDASVAPTEDLDLGEGLSIVSILEPNSTTFVDNVGAGSPFYSYRVYAFKKEGDHYIFSHGSPLATKSVGRLLVKYKLKSVGTEYLWSYSQAERFDMRVEAYIYTGQKLVDHYNYWFDDAGSVWSGNTVVWETKADDWKSESDCDCVPIDQNLKVVTLGREGMNIRLHNTADVDDDKCETGFNIIWPYSQFVSSLAEGNATGESGSAPFNKRENVFTWGKNGITYSANCDNCGEEPHSGIKIYFEYDWLDD